MACDPRRLEALFFGELPLAEAASVQRHAAACLACSRELKALRDEQACFRARRSGPGALDRLFPEIERRIQARSPRFRLRAHDVVRSLVPLGGAALALMMMLVAPQLPAVREGGAQELDGALAICSEAPSPVDPAFTSAPAMCLADSPAALACF